GRRVGEEGGEGRGRPHGAGGRPLREEGGRRLRARGAHRGHRRGDDALAGGSAGSIAPRETVLYGRRFHSEGVLRVRLFVQHHSFYTYDDPALLGPHVIRLKPAS